MMNKTSLKYFLVGAMILTMASCKKNNLIVDQDPLTPPEAARFIMTPTIATNFYSYFILENPAPGSQFKIPVGLTTVSNEDRKIKFTYSSLRAVNGVQYTAPDELTIPAGQTIDTLRFQGIFAGYPTGRRDTVKIKISNADGYVNKNGYQDSLMLIIQKYCPVVLTDLGGDYDNTRDITPAYGPYSTSVTSTSTGTTTANIVVSNFWDFGFDDLTFKLNWTSAAAFTVTLDPQNTGQDAGIMDDAYAGMELWIYPPASGTGTFSSCDQSITINFRLGIPNLGYFPAYQTILRR